MRSNLFFKVVVDHEPGENVERLGIAIARQIQKVYGVRTAELQNATNAEGEDTITVS